MGVRSQSDLSSLSDASTMASTPLISARPSVRNKLMVSQSSSEGFRPETCDTSRALLAEQTAGKCQERRGCSYCGDGVTTTKLNAVSAKGTASSKHNGSS